MCPLKRVSLILIITLVLLLLLGGAVSAGEGDEWDNYLGDVNEDGVVNVGDTILVLKHIVGLNILEGEPKQVADVNLDGTVSVGDAILILRNIMGLIDEFPVSEPALVFTEKALHYALEQSEAETIRIYGDLTFSGTLEINRAVTIDGAKVNPGRHSIDGNIAVNASGVTLSNLEVDGKVSMVGDADNFTADNTSITNLYLVEGGSTPQGMSILSGPGNVNLNNSTVNNLHINNLGRRISLSFSRVSRALINAATSFTGSSGIASAVRSVWVPEEDVDYGEEEPEEIQEASPQSFTLSVELGSMRFAVTDVTSDVDSPMDLSLIPFDPEQSLISFYEEGNPGNNIELTFEDIGLLVGMQGTEGQKAIDVLDAAGLDFNLHTIISAEMRDEADSWLATPDPQINIKEYTTTCPVTGEADTLIEVATAQVVCSFLDDSTTLNLFLSRPLKGIVEGGASIEERFSVHVNGEEAVIDSVTLGEAESPVEPGRMIENGLVVITVDDSGDNPHFEPGDKIAIQYEQAEHAYLEGYLGLNVIDFALDFSVYNVTQETYHATIQEAIDAAVDNDEIQVAAGTFTGALVIDIAGLQLSGAGPEESIVEGDVVLDGATFAHLENLYIDGNLTGAYGLHLENTIVTGNAFVGSPATGLYNVDILGDADFGTAIGVFVSSDSSIGGTVYGQALYGLQVLQSDASNLVRGEDRPQDAYFAFTLAQTNPDPGAEGIGDIGEGELVELVLQGIELDGDIASWELSHPEKLEIIDIVPGSAHDWGQEALIRLEVQAGQTLEAGTTLVISADGGVIETADIDWGQAWAQRNIGGPPPFTLEARFDLDPQHVVPPAWVEPNRVNVDIYDPDPDIAEDIYFEQEFRVFLAQHQFEENIDPTHFDLGGVFAGEGATHASLSIGNVARDGDHPNQATLTVSGILNISEEDWHNLGWSTQGSIIVLDSGHKGAGELSAGVWVSPTPPPLWANPGADNISVYEDVDILVDWTFEIYLREGEFVDLDTSNFDLGGTFAGEGVAFADLNIDSISGHGEYENCAYITISGTLNIGAENWVAHWVAEGVWEPMIGEIITRQAAHSGDEDLSATVSLYPADQVGFPYFNVDPQTNTIWGHWWSDGETLEIKIGEDLVEPDFFLSGAADSNGDFYWVVDIGDYNIQPGDLVTVSGDTITKQHRVTVLQIEGVDLEASIVYGTAEPGTEVIVRVYLENHDGPNPQRTVTVDQFGNWHADFSEPGEYGDDFETLLHDIQSGDHGAAWQWDKDIDSTCLNWHV